MEEAATSKVVVICVGSNPSRSIKFSLAPVAQLEEAATLKVVVICVGSIPSRSMNGM